MDEEPLPALLTGEGADLTDPGQVDRALATLWRPPAGYRAADPVGAATRVCAANLLVVADEADRTWISQVLGSLSPRYPTRTIVWLADVGSRRRSKSRSRNGDTVRAWVFALCHVPQPGRPQVCCEQIVLREPTGDTECDLMQTILPLLESDVPTMGWWRLPVGSRRPWYRALVGLSDRLIVDAGPAGLARYKEAAGRVVRELGWYRTAHWRDWLAGLFDGDAAATLESLTELHVRTGPGDRDARTDAVWIAAFVAGQLGWKPVQYEADGWRLAAGERPVRVRIDEDPIVAAGIDSVTLSDDSRRCEVARWAGARNAYRIAEHTGVSCRLPRTVEAPRADAADALVAALTGRPSDRAFERAAPIAAWLAGTSTRKTRRGG